MKILKGVLEGMLAARVMFYLGVLGLILSGLAVPMPEWHVAGIRPLGFVQLADTCFLMTIAILLHQIATNTTKSG